MMLSSLIAATMSLLDAAPHPHIFLQCEPSMFQVDPREIKDFYKTPPADASQFTKDVWNHSIIGLVIEPQKQWLVDFDKQLVQPLDGNFPNALNITKVSSFVVEAETKPGAGYRKITLDRTTGRLDLIVTGDVTSWNEAFGVSIASWRIWTLDCKPGKPLF